MEVSCQCGNVQFTTLTSKPITIYICHCTECRRQSGSAFGISAIFPKFDIKNLVPEDAIAEYIRPTGSGRPMHCFFCKNCGSRLLNVRDGVGSVSVKGGCLSGLTKNMMASAVHIWTQEAVVEIPKGAENHLGEPPDD